MNIVVLKFQYNQIEYCKADRQYLIANKIIHRYDFVLVGIFLLFSTANLFFSSFHAFSIFIFVLVAVVSLLGSYLYFLMPILKFRQTAKYQEEYTLRFSKEVILFQTPSITSEIRWNLYPELWVNQDFYFLIQAPRIYTLIPKRVFQDNAEMQAFEALAQCNGTAIKHIT